VSYSGYKLDAKEIHLLEGKVVAIQDALSPCLITELKSYIGLLSYYRRLLPNLIVDVIPSLSVVSKESALEMETRKRESIFDVQVLTNVS